MELWELIALIYGIAIVAFYLLHREYNKSFKRNDDNS